MLPDPHAVPNLGSRVLALSVRRLAEDWRVVHGHPVVLAETFVDPRRFPGTLAQRPIDAKTNEITEARPLLQPLDLRGKVVTADAMRAQVNLARFLARDKGTDQVFTVKDNHLGSQGPSAARSGVRPDQPA